MTIRNEAGEQGDQAPDGHRRDLPERGPGHSARRGGPLSRAKRRRANRAYRRSRDRPRGGRSRDLVSATSRDDASTGRRIRGIGGARHRATRSDDARTSRPARAAQLRVKGRPTNPAADRRCDPETIQRTLIGRQELPGPAYRPPAPRWPRRPPRAAESSGRRNRVVRGIRRHASAYSRPTPPADQRSSSAPGSRRKGTRSSAARKRSALVIRRIWPGHPGFTPYRRQLARAGV